MAVIKELTTENEWNDMYRKSNEKKVYVFKHSTQCPISAEANEVYEKYVSNYTDDDAEFCLVKVIESRPISNLIANDLEVTHHSPQLIIVEDESPSWCDTHRNITIESIKTALNEV
ncbi:bacillithiol system redox-active protein YtxJ [Alkalihalobacillus sp. 1P02AB]|uniref:bacillithiol system redox-active protein YtxJ n=1 Tax=Alkalihalobacillus sp. 1P02AB TaxID=3132260 RepID=UPI0039A40C28